ncbi:unnamed protein product [Microthlaspi erraticum]|uniref:Uncharacterized protein n=1 Tax=Microthlaspi erraticum TaxID=1685480 RepID=A0A6D2HWU4_9BRAS|nr:unnamed protein product [Microthlaspi erraticum]
MLVEELKELKKSFVESLELQNTMIRKMEEEGDEKVKEELMIANATMEKMARDMTKVCLQKVGVTMLVVGTLGRICGKRLSRFVGSNPKLALASGLKAASFSKKVPTTNLLGWERFFLKLALLDIIANTFYASFYAC